MLSHTKFETALNICHITFLLCVRIKPHSFRLANLENATSKFRQCVQICCREEERQYWQLQSFLRYTQTQIGKRQQRKVFSFSPIIQRWKKQKMIYKHQNLQLQNLFSCVWLYFIGMCKRESLILRKKI